MEVRGVVANELYTLLANVILLSIRKFLFQRLKFIFQYLHSIIEVFH